MAVWVLLISLELKQCWDIKYIKESYFNSETLEKNIGLVEDVNILEYNEIVWTCGTSKIILQPI